MNNKREIIVIACVLALTLASMSLSMAIQAVELGYEKQYVLPVWQGVVVILAILSVFSIGQMGEINKENIKNQLQNEHFKEIETLLTAARVERHEYRKHLQALQSCLHLGMVEEAERYLEGISRQPENEEWLAIDHPALFGLVNSKYALARSRGIAMDVSVECDLSGLKIEPWDLCSMVGNLLDNALEAAVFDDKGPWVGLECRKCGGNYEIVVTNNGRTVAREDISRVFEAGFSTKESSGRGYGMYIVKNLVEGCRGEIEMVSDRRTAVKIILPEDGHDRQNIAKSRRISSREVQG